MEEVEMLTLAGKHPNIVTMQEFYEDQEAYYIVMELCKGGELFNRLVDKVWFSLFFISFFSFLFFLCSKAPPFHPT